MPKERKKTGANKRVKKKNKQDGEEIRARG